MHVAQYLTLDVFKGLDDGREHKFHSASQFVSTFRFFEHLPTRTPQSLQGAYDIGLDVDTRKKGGACREPLDALRERIDNTVFWEYLGERTIQVAALLLTFSTARKRL